MPAASMSPIRRASRSASRSAIVVERGDGCRRIPHQALETGVEIAAAAQERAVAVEHLDRAERFLGGDALVRRALQRAGERGRDG